VLFVSGCASRKLPPIGAAGQAYQPEADEQELWARAEKEEQALLKRVKVYEDPLLAEYLGSLANRLLPGTVRAAGGPAMKVGVIRDPTLNAFAMPNGKIYIHTGLLSRLENEAQLATILARETAHITHRHALTYIRDTNGKPTPYTVGAIGSSIGVAVAASAAKPGDIVGTAVLSPTANAVLGLGLTLTTVAAIQGYGRDPEREADQEGLERLVRAGYAPEEALKIFQILVAETADRGPVEIFLYGTHGPLRERVETVTPLVKTRYAAAAGDAPRIRQTEEFQLRTRAVVRENASEDIRMGRFALAERQLERTLAATPRDPTAYVYYGDLYRLRSQRAKSPEEKKADAGRALERYERATELDATLPDAWRQLGLLYYQQQDKARAKAAFAKYLALAPDATDAKRIKEYQLELDR
jgi:beta-barrel assembly-enhancing protease